MSAMNNMAWKALLDKCKMAFECLIADLGYGAWRDPECNACKVCIAARYVLLAVLLTGLWMFSPALTIVAVLSWLIWALWTGEAAVLPDYLTTKFRDLVNRFIAW